MRRNGPKWLVAICDSSPSAVRRNGVRHDAGVVDEQVDRPELARRLAPAARTEREVGQVDDQRGRGRRRAPRRVIASAGRVELVGVRPASTTRAPWRASSRAVWKPRPPSVGPVTTRGASGLVADVVGRPGGLAHGVTASAARTRLAELVVAGDAYDVRLGRPATPASTTKVSRSMDRVDGRARRRPAWRRGRGRPRRRRRSPARGRPPRGVRRCRPAPAPACRRRRAGSP